MKRVLTTILIISLISMLSLTAFSFGVIFVVGGPPSSGDWIVTGTESYGDQTIVLDGNLTVENGGNLTFRNVTLKMNCTYDAQYHIEVRSGGKFYVLDGSVITAVDPEEEFLFDVYAESIFRMNGSELHECGIEDGGSGLSIDQSDAVIENSLLSNNWYAIICSNCNPVIRNNNISSNKFEAVLLDHSNGTIEGNHIENSGAGIRGDFYSSPVVRGNTIVNDGWPIHFYNYCSPIIQDNTLIANDKGITCKNSNPTIQNNNISQNHNYGINCSDCTGIIQGNVIAENGIGIELWGNSSSNIVYDNSFMNNTEQAPVTEGLNVWDNGAEGNYWSDYAGVDSNHDGIGDAMHVIDSNSTDRYPLMGMFSDFNATLEHHVQIVCNSSLSNFVFNGAVITFDAAAKDNTAGFCRICIPTDLINETYRIFVNRTEVQYTTLSCSNTTHKYLYFNYAHPREKVLIINADWYKANALTGDVNRDMKVDMKDVASAATCFGYRAADSRWNPSADVTGDGTIDIRDLVAIAKHFGEYYP